MNQTIDELKKYFPIREEVYTRDETNKIALAKYVAMPNTDPEVDPETGLPVVLFEGMTWLISTAHLNEPFLHFLGSNGQPITPTAAVGNNNTTNNRFVYTGGSWAWEKEFLPPVELSAYTKQASFNQVTRPSRNLLDKSLLVSGSYYGTNGNVFSDANWRRVGQLIPVAPNTAYRMTGVNANYIGTGYSANSAVIANFTETLGNNVGDKTNLDFVTGPNTNFIGLNISNKQSGSPGAYDNTAMLRLKVADDSDTYEAYGFVLRAAAITDPLPYASKATQDRVDAAFSTSYNLANGALAMHKKAYGNNTPPFYPAQNSAGGDCLPPIRIKPDTNYFLDGINAGFPGSLMDENFNRLAKIAEPVSGSDFTSVQFNSGAAVWACININNLSATREGRYDKTVQLTEGIGRKPYMPYGPLVAGSRVVGFNDVYYSYAHSDTTPYFMVYFKIGGAQDLYSGVKLSLTTKSEDKQNCWRINGADLFRFDGTTMEALSINLLSAGLENEFVYFEKGKKDYVGGYHGDELFTDIQFFVDGVAIAMPTANVALTGCRKFHYRQRSDMYEAVASNSSVNILVPAVLQGQHIKTTEFSRDRFRTENTMLWGNGVAVADPVANPGGRDMDEFVAGLLCVGKPAASIAYTQRSAVQNMTGSGNTYFNEVGGSNEFYSANALNNLSTRTKVDVLTATRAGLDVRDLYFNICKAEVWDRSAPPDSKVYFRTPRGNGLVKVYPGDIWTVALEHWITYKA